MVQVGTALAAEFSHSGYELHYTHVAGDKTTVWVHSRFADIFLIPFLHNWLKLRPGTVSYTQLAAWCSSVPLNNAERVFLPKLCILVRQQDELLPISSCCTSHCFKPADLHHQQKTSKAQNPCQYGRLCVWDPYGSEDRSHCIYRAQSCAHHVSSLLTATPWAEG